MRIFDAHMHAFERPYSDLYDNSHIRDGVAGGTPPHSGLAQRADLGPIDSDRQ